MGSISRASPFAFANSRNLNESENSLRQFAWLFIAIVGLIANACGGGSSVVNPPPPSAKEALYLSTGLTPNSLLTFVFDTGTGTLEAPVSVAGAPAGIDIKVHPGGNFLYVS